MTGVGIWGGITSAATIAAVLYLMDRGYEWWQILLVVLLGLSLAPSFKSYIQKGGDE